MSTTCPKCGHVRRNTDTAPDWQCPACGVAYAKAAEAAAARVPAAQSKVIYQPKPQVDSQRYGWLVAVVVLSVLWLGLRALASHGGMTGMVMQAAGAVSTEDLHALAATVKPGDIVVYSTSTCSSCAQTKSWLGSNGFAYTECDVEREARCDREFSQLHGQAVPLLVVRGKRMSEGFDGGEFVAALRS